MHIYTILGAAVADASFRDLLFVSPHTAANRLGITLTRFELQALEQLLKKGDELKNAFEELSIVVCPRKPCPFALADSQVGCDDATDTSSMSSAAD